MRIEVPEFHRETDPGLLKRLETLRKKAKDFEPGRRKVDQAWAEFEQAPIESFGEQTFMTGNKLQFEEIKLIQAELAIRGELREVYNLYTTTESPRLKALKSKQVEEARKKAREILHKAGFTNSHGEAVIEHHQAVLDAKDECKKTLMLHISPEFSENDKAIENLTQKLSVLKQKALEIQKAFR